MKKLLILFAFLPIMANAATTDVLRQRWAACCALSDADTNECLTLLERCQASYTSTSGKLNFIVNCTRNRAATEIACRRNLKAELTDGITGLSRDEAIIYCEQIGKSMAHEWAMANSHNYSLVCTASRFADIGGRGQGLPDVGLKMRFDTVQQCRNHAGINICE